MVDVDLETFQMDPADLRSKVTNNTSAIMPVHIYGQGSKICDIIHIANEFSLKVIEDAAQVLGVKYRNLSCESCPKRRCCARAPRHLGTFGDIGMFSLYADKTVTSGEGGILVTNDDALFDRIKLLRNQGRPNSGTFIHSHVGMNFRITDLQASILNIQLAKLDRIKMQRRELYEIYIEHLKNAPCGTMQLDPSSEFIPFRFTLTFNGFDISTILDRLDQAKVQARRFFYPMHLQPAFSDLDLKKCPNSQKLYDTGICLPIHRNIDETHVSYMLRAIFEGSYS